MNREKVLFRLHPEAVQSATRVILYGDFNNWNPDNGIDLQPQEDGSYITELELESGEYQYRYYLSDGRWANDFNETVPSPAFGNSIRNCVVKVEHVVIEVPEATVENEPKTDVKKSTSKKQNVKKATEPKSKSKGVGSESTQFTRQYHDLTEIEGITKPVMDLLYEHDIRTFGLIAKLSGKKLNEILRKGGSQFDGIDAAKWPKIAKEISANLTAKANSSKEKNKK